MVRVLSNRNGQLNQRGAGNAAPGNVTRVNNFKTQRVKLGRGGKLRPGQIPGGPKQVGPRAFGGGGLRPGQIPGGPKKVGGANVRFPVPGTQPRPFGVPGLPPGQIPGGAQQVAGQQPQQPVAPQGPQGVNPTSVGGLGLAGANVANLGISRLGDGKASFSAGTKNIQQGVDELLGTKDEVESSIGRVLGELDTRRGLEQQQLGNLSTLQGTALDPTLSAGKQQEFANEAQRRRDQIESRFDIGGDAATQFARDQANALADLANSGQLGTRTGSNVLARIQSDLIGQRANALQAADEISRQELLNERNRIGQTAQGFGGLSAGLAGQQGGLVDSLLGREQSGIGLLQNIGQGIGQLGVGQAEASVQQNNVGANLIGTGLNALNQSLGRGLESRGLEADLQLGQSNQRNQLRQQALNNLVRRRQQKKQNEFLEKQLDIAKQQADALEDQANASSSGGFSLF